MKKQIIIGAAIAVIATPALASKARLVALGEEITGSQYIKDSRNVFLNAAHVNNYKNFVVMELGNDGTSAKNDTESDAQAEGGVFAGHGNMVYGLYLGAESAQAYEARQVLNVSDRRVHQDNQLDVFVGGDAGIKWGANLTYQSNKDDDGDIKNDSLSARLGVMENNWEAFVNLSLVNKFEGDLGGGTEDEEFNGKLGYEIGGTLNAGPGKAFAFWRHSGWEQETDVAVGAGTGAAYTGEADVKFDRYIIGYGVESKISDKTTMFWKASYLGNKRKLETDDGDADLNDYRVPVVVGLEHDANEWLVLRGSVTHNLVAQADNDYDSTLTTAGVNVAFTNVAYKSGKRTIASSTNVNTGATIHFGDFSVDGLLGLNGGTSTAESGILGTDNLLARVAMSYKW